MPDIFTLQLSNTVLCILYLRYEGFRDCIEQDDDTEIIKHNDERYHNYAESIDPHKVNHNSYF
jgi:hypothetical protein